MEFLFFYIVIGFFLVAVIVLNTFLPQIKGYVGERRIRNLLENLGDEYTVFNDIYVPKKDGKTTQIDHILLSPYGIFVIETKNYDGWIFGQEHQKNWTQTIYKKKSRFYNPIMQNRTHVNALQHYLQEDVPMHSVIVFSNAATFKFKEPFQKAIVIQNRQLKKTIQQFTTPQFTAQQLGYFQQLLEDLQPKTSKEKNEIKKEHLQRAKEKANPKKSTVKPKKHSHSPILEATVLPEKKTHSDNEYCPRCNSELVLRNSKRGQFYGCSLFPKCRFTKEIERTEFQDTKK